MPTVTVLMPVAGDPSWSAGDEVDLPTDVYDVWCDGVRTAPADIDQWSVKQVTDWVGTSATRAAYAVGIEQQRDKPRSSLVDELTHVIAVQAWLAAEAAWVAEHPDLVPAGT